MLTHIIEYHFIKGALYHAGMWANQKLETFSGDSIIVTMDSGGTYVAGKRICEFDISVSNGVIHEVEEVLFPPGRV